jgi:TPR repeat protein
MNLPLDRSETELVSLQRAANAGQGKAAYALCQYYGFVKFDEEKERYWLERAAQLNYAPAMISLGNILIESSSPIDRRRGRLMLQRGAIGVSL